jgi:lipopolysaccharide export system ATP-binding protein
MKHTRGERMKIANQLLEELGLTKVIRNRAYTLSGGERRRLEISRALATNPSLILLDEPFSGVDPKAVSDIQVIITQLRNRGIGILLTDHNVRDTLEVTNRAYIIHDGKILTSGMPEQIVKDPLAKEFYLGQKFEDMEFKWPTGN